MTPRLSQSFPVPSVKAMQSTNTPMSSVRGSVQAASARRRGVPLPGAGWSAVRAAGRKWRAAVGTATATARAAAIRCAVTGTCSATMTAPTPAPATVPMLHPAWNRGRIARPSSRSTAAPCTFIATSQAPLPKPNTNSPAATSGMPPGPRRQPAAATIRPAAAAQAMTTTVRRCPSQPMSTPDRGVPRVEPTAPHSRTSPRAPGPTCSSDRICGIRDAQLA